VCSPSGYRALSREADGAIAVVSVSLRKTSEKCELV
jgi:hypothetical protein